MHPRDAAGAPIGGVIGAPRPLALGPGLPTEVAAACANLDTADIDGGALTLEVPAGLVQVEITRASRPMPARIKPVPTLG